MMMSPSLVINVLWLLPLVAALVAWRLPSVRAILGVILAVVVVLVPCAVWLVALSLRLGRVTAASQWLLVDALSGFHLLVMLVVFGLSAIFAWSYFGAEVAHGHFSLRQARRFGALWLGAQGAMTAVLISNNLAMQWVGIEATTLLTAFLISTHTTSASLEATWKYLMICSVGVAFAFVGTLLVATAAMHAHTGSHNALLWTELLAAPERLDPLLIKAGFVFLLVGYGTKAGLAPMHSWLPDAHSQAPAPVSALFSGFLLNAALYCLMRYLPVVEGAPTLTGFAPGLLVFFGVVSVIVAAAFILFQTDAKRLLAYCSVEHLGIVALGLGLGGVGTFAALFHTLNHSVAKSLAFFAAGRLGQTYGTHDMNKLTRTLHHSPVWGTGLFVSLLALVGAAPFALFMSELQVVMAASHRHAYWTLGLFLAGAAVVFVGMLRRAIAMAWGGAAAATPRPGFALLDLGLVLLCVAALVTLGLFIPPGLNETLVAAARIAGGGR
ncbi:MAG: hydrogenase 4 subunit F [Deltaproteobacteria bacterium]|nr:hydrogenase 4 subunit F [Deltaproteobacteria bacterium]